MGLSMWPWFSSLWGLLVNIPPAVLTTNHARADVPDCEDAVYHSAMAAVKRTAALVAMLAFRATAPITLPDKTSGFNGIAGYDLKV